MSSISNAEWIVMKILWAAAPMTAQEVIERLPDDVDWADKTVKTLLGRLVRKGVLGFEKRGREHVYVPVVDEHECKLEETRSFLDRVFDGKVAPLVAHLVDHDSLSKRDLDALRRLLDDASKHGRKKASKRGGSR